MTDRDAWHIIEGNINLTSLTDTCLGGLCTNARMKAPSMSGCSRALQCCPGQREAEEFYQPKAVCGNWTALSASVSGGAIISS